MSNRSVSRISTDFPIPYASTVSRLGMRYENASTISSRVPTYQTYGLPTTDAIFPIFPPSSEIPAVPNESNPFRHTL